MKNLTVERKLLSNRYSNDGKPIRKLSAYQESMVARFLQDKKIKQTEIDGCAICGGREFLLIAEKDQFGIPLTTGICKSCGLVQSMEQMDEESTIRFYSEYYRKIYEGVPEPTLDHGFYKNLYSGKMVPSPPRFLSEDATILEIGCGGGWNLLPFHKRGIKHYGFDYDGNMIDYGRRTFGLNLFSGGVGQAIEIGVKADYVILSHVLEHASNPIRFLENLAKVIRVGGVLRLTVPSINYLGYLGGSGTSYDFGLNLQNAHNFTFSENSLRMVLSAAGYRPVVLVGGFCIAKNVGKNVSRGNVHALNYKRDWKIIQNSEKSLFMKNWLHARSPRVFRRYLSYVHYLDKPLQLIKYFMINQGVTKI